MTQTIPAAQYRQMTAKKAREKLSEKAIHQAVIDHWRDCGVPGSLVATLPNMRAFGQAGLTKGLPDLMVLSPTLGDKTGFLELKKVGGLLSEAQADFGQLCHMRGIPWAVTYGRDEPIKVLEQWGAVKAVRDA